MDRYRIKPGSIVGILQIDPGEKIAFDHLTKSSSHEILAGMNRELAELQRKLWSDGQQALLVVLQAMDTGGKDGTIRAVMQGINPAGCQVFSFKQPSHHELDHDFLWRTTCRLPERGRIGIFNRSYCIRDNSKFL